MMNMQIKETKKKESYLMNKYILYIILLLSHLSYSATYCDLVGLYIIAQDDNIQFLGKISDSKLDYESIINDNGTYGSKYSTKSIRNTTSLYGSSSGTYSAYNKYSIHPPIAYYMDNDGKYHSRWLITKNNDLLLAVDPDTLIQELIRGCSNVKIIKKGTKVNITKLKFTKILIKTRNNQFDNIYNIMGRKSIINFNINFQLE